MSEALADIRTRAEGAVLATAVGDALGWPQEDRSRRIGTSSTTDATFDLAEWRRRDGGRYAAHEELIAAGSYSDDTQLVLAVARSLSMGDAWFDHLARGELPFWLAYERGGGAATKRSARSWAAGKPPWASAKAAAYFAAGGNGVAMRVLPHALRGPFSDDFSATASAVVKDGITTHGHPVALIGALAYSYALWLALRREGLLEYGALVQMVQADVARWAAMPNDLPDEWRAAADSDSDGSYEARWNETVAAMLDLLSIAAGAMAEGALAIDRETLEQLGAFERSVSGAGTVTAASAILIASRYASRPLQGLLSAGFAHGADTDTLAAMAGGLLGAINGRDWLDAVAHRVQDYDYLVAAARNAVKQTFTAPPVERPQNLRRLWRQLEQAEVNDRLALPDGRQGVLLRIEDLPTKTRHKITVYVVRTDDGQTLFLKRVARLQGARRPQESQEQRDGRAPEERSGETSSPPRARKAVVAVEAANMDETVAFYRDLIGLEMTRRTSHYASFGDDVVVVPANGAAATQRQLDIKPEGQFDGTPKIYVFVEVDEVEHLREKLRKAAVPVSALAPGQRGAHRFSCLDPDGTVVEVRQVNGT